MLFLAGLLGLMAVGGVAVMDLASTLDAEDSEADPMLDETGSELANTGAQIGGDVSMADPLHGRDPGLMPDPEPAMVPRPDADEPTPGQVLAGGPEAEILGGGPGGDQINGYGGDDRLLGGEGSDDLHGAEGRDTLDGGAGEDTLRGWGGDDNLFGAAGKDTLFGHEGADELAGGAGDDSIHGGEGDDRIDGDAGDDALHGGLGNDLLDGGGGQDSLFGGSGADTLSGLDPLASEDMDASVRDYLNGGGGDDLILAGEGDIITAGEGADTVVLASEITGREAAQVLDYDPEEDRLLITWDLQSDPDPDIEVSRDPDLPSLSRITVDGVEIAQVRSADPIPLSDILLIDQAHLSAMTQNRIAAG